LTDEIYFAVLGNLLDLANRYPAALTFSLPSSSSRASQR
jgi:hypothetical protein